ncbi:MAG: thioredoxin family protein [Dehalococcoidia bacterium]
MKRSKAVRLDVYVEAGCPSCKRAVKIAQEAGKAYPDMAVTIIDVAESDEPPADVFAVPTFVLNGDVVSLGNPTRADLSRAIESASGRR